MFCLIAWGLQEAMGEFEEPDALSSVGALEEASTLVLTRCKIHICWIKMKCCGFRQESLGAHNPPTPSLRHSLCGRDWDSEEPLPPRNALCCWRWALGFRLRQQNLKLLLYCLDKQIHNNGLHLSSVKEVQRKDCLGLLLSWKSLSQSKNNWFDICIY